jgi:Formyl transferase
MHVGVITYQTGHRKTLGITLKLLTKGYRVTHFAFPFVQRRKSASYYPDRPQQLLDYDVRDFCTRAGVDYRPVEGWTDTHATELGKPGENDAPEVFLSCIAKIIPATFIEGRTILNCHPGMLPHNRGVDAFKWSIVNAWPVGVTLHAIDEVIDRGTILFRRLVPIFANDTLPALCQRAYDFECDLLANFDVHLDNLRHKWLVGDTFPISHKRIPKEIDDRLEAVFLEKRAELMDATRPRSWRHEVAESEQLAT